MSNRKYKICFVAPEAYGVFSDMSGGPVGGAEIQQMLIGKALAKAGHAVHVVVKDKVYKDQYQWQGMTIHPCRFRYLLGSNWYFVPDTIRLIALMKRIGADFNLLKTPTCMLFAMALHRKLFGGKLIKLMAHDEDCRRRGRSLSSYLYPISVGCLDYTVFQSQYQLVEGGKGLGLKGSVIKNIAHGNIKVSTEDKTIDVLWVGSCSKRKQPELFAALARRLPNVAFTIILSGTENNPYADTVLEEMAKCDNITNIGQVRHDEIDTYYSRAKLLVSTSETNGEGFPNTFLQAWQFGIPVISMNVNPDNVLTDNKIGLVSGSFEKMIQDVQTLLSNDNLRERFGENSIKYMKNNHSSETIIDNYEEIFRKLS